MTKPAGNSQTIHRRAADSGQVEPSTDDRTRTAEWLLLRRTSRAVTEAYAAGVSAENIANDLNMPPARVHTWAKSGTPTRSVLEILSERAVGDIEPEDAWSELVNLDWWEFEPSGPTMVDAQLIGPVTEVPQAVLLGLLSLNEWKLLADEIKPRRTAIPVRRPAVTFRSDVPVSVIRAARCLVAIRARRAIWSAHLADLTGLAIANRIGVPEAQVRNVLRSVAARGVDPTGIEHEATATVDTWRAQDADSRPADD